MDLLASVPDRTLCHLLEEATTPAVTAKRRPQVHPLECRDTSASLRERCTADHFASALDHDDERIVRLGFGEVGIQLSVVLKPELSMNVFDQPSETFLVIRLIDGKTQL